MNANVAVLLTVTLIGCASMTTQGGSRMKIHNCEVVMDDTLGTLPPSHGGPTAKGEIGNGIMCDVARW